MQAMMKDPAMVKKILDMNIKMMEQKYRPTMIRNKFFSEILFRKCSFPDTKPRKDLFQQVVVNVASGDGVQKADRPLDLLRNEFQR